MVGHTRGSPEGFGRETGSGSQQPPPPPPNLAELMAMQTELLRQLCKGSRIRHANSSVEDMMSNQRVTRNSLVPNLRCSAGLMNHWTPMLGSVLLSPSLPC